MGKNRVGGNTAHWDDEATLLFGRLCVDQIELGNRPTTFFNKPGWGTIVDKFNLARNTTYDRAQLKNKWDQLKKEWKLWKQLKGSETGLGWDATKSTVAASPEWWEEKIMANPMFKKFKVCGISPELEACLDQMYSSIVATGQHGYSPSCGALPQGMTETVGDSEDGGNPQPTESGSESCSDLIRKKRRRFTKTGKKKQKNSRCRSTYDGTSSISPEVRSLLRACETITTTAASVSQRMSSAPSISEAMEVIQRLFSADMELFSFAVNHIKVRSNREAWMCMTDDQKTWWMENEYKRKT